MEYCNNPIKAILMAQTLQEWMFGGIPPGKKTKTKHPTSNEVLAEIGRAHV